MKDWRKTPKVKRLVFRVLPDEATKFAALKRGEVDMTGGFGAELAREVRSGRRDLS